MSLEDMAKLISVYDSIQNLKEILLGSRDEYWDGGGVLTAFEYVFDIISHAVTEEGETYKEIIAILEDKMAAPMDRAKKLIGKAGH